MQVVSIVGVFAAPVSLGLSSLRSPLIILWSDAPPTGGAVPWNVMTSPISSVKQWCRTHPFATDVILMLVVVAMVVATLFGTAEPDESQRGIDAFGVILAIGSAIPVAFRRKEPAVSLAVATLFTSLYWVLDYVGSGVGAPLLISAYSAAAYVKSAARARAVGFGFAAVVGVVIVAGLIYTGENLSIFDAIATFVFYQTAWLFGNNVRTHRVHLEEVQKRALAAEAQRETEAARAIEQERTAIARELHDVVAHGLSVMVVQAAAARRVLKNGIASADDTARAEKAIAAVEDTGRASLDEMRRLLGVLRPGTDDQTSLAPLPGLEDLDQLVDQVESAGLPVAMAIEGEVRSLPPGIELSAYRIVQESLTNAIKHAGPAEARVTLSYDTNGLAVEVADDGRGGAARPGDAHAGQGLRGMRERVESIGGTFQAGPKAGGGYRVKAKLPVVTS